MKNKNINDILRQKNIVVPIYLIKLISKLDITTEVFLFLMYLNSYGIKISFDPNIVSKEYGIDIPILMGYIDTLTSKKLISFEISTNDKNITEEYLSLDNFYNKVSMLMVEELNKNSSINPNSVFELIEKEFGRMLSPIEYEIIKAWTETDISEELIRQALKEAVFNGVTNLRYIDKILYEWQKKGFKTKQDVEKNSVKHKETIKKQDVFDYDWLDEE